MVKVRPRGRLVDRLAGRVLGLGRPTTAYVVGRGARVPMRDGVMLAADLYRPVSPPLGTVLVRGPYGRGLSQSLLSARVFAARGYQVLFVSSRGTFGSGGVFTPMLSEAEDGQDVVAWMRRQSWFTGTFATIGLSYLGYTQWALLADPPPELVAAVVAVGPHDFSRHHWGTGAFNLDALGWSDLIAHQQDAALAHLFHLATSARRLRPVLDAVPLVDAAERHFAGRAPWYREVVTHPDPDDAFWAPMRHTEALDRVTVPVLLIGGWQDIFLPQTVQQYARLRERDVDVALTIGPWSHQDLVGKGAPAVAQETLTWLDEHLAHRAGRRRSTPVAVYVTGARRWRRHRAWPPPTTPHALYLRTGGALSPDAPSRAERPSTFTFDPADPTPTVGGPTLTGGGYCDDTALSERTDVLAFTGPVLDADLDVLGPPAVELEHEGDNPHADLFVRLSDVDSQGRSHNVTEGYVRLDPARATGGVSVRMRDTAHSFVAGHRVRLLVAGGSHPQYARNLGTGEHPGTGKGFQPARHVLRHDADRPSCVVLPVAASGADRAG
ncbi:MAG TPA: CocE/NonD family hydrolase [Streptosporangiales bacterium]